MSHSSGTVTFKRDNKEYWFEYNGTSDVCIPQIYDTQEEMSANWRNGEWRECQCGQDEEVVILSHYGGGFDWEGRACRHCMCITDNLIPKEFQYEEDEKGWWY